MELNPLFSLVHFFFDPERFELALFVFSLILKNLEQICPFFLQP